MTTAYRDTATRCERCERVVRGCGYVRLTTHEALMVAVLREVLLCTRCRSLVADRFEESVKPPAMVNDL